MYYRDENNQWQKIILEPSGDTLPIGTIAQFGGSTAPTNWLICNGQAISRTTYSELFSVIGTTYGDGDGSTTFNLPDFSSRSPMGLGTGTDGTNNETTTLGQEKGEYKHQLTVAELAAHDHEIYEFNTNNAGSWTYGGIAVLQGAAQGTGATRQHTTITGEDEAHNTIHPVLGVNFIIKAKQSIGLVGNITTDITDPNNDAVPNASTVKGYVDASIQNEKNIMSSTMSSSSSYSNNTVLPLTVATSIGNKLISENGKITIGAGVSKVLVSASLYVNYDATNSKVYGFKLNRNYTNSSNESESEEFVSARTQKSVGQPLSISSSPKLIEVSEGDVIEMTFITDASSTTPVVRKSTYLTVEVIR